MMMMIQNTPFYWFHRDISPDDPEFTELIRQAELAVDHGVFPQRIYQVALKISFKRETVPTFKGFLQFFPNVPLNFRAQAGATL